MKNQHFDVYKMFDSIIPQCKAPGLRSTYRQKKKDKLKELIIHKHLYKRVATKSLIGPS